MVESKDLEIKTLGACRIDSPLLPPTERRSSVHNVEETDRVLFDDTRIRDAVAKHVGRTVARLRTGRTATQDILRSVEDSRGSRHLRRTLPRVERRYRLSWSFISITA